MTTDRLKFISDNTLLKLANSVGGNIDRYKSGNFLDLTSDIGWQIETNSVNVNMEKLSQLKSAKGSAEEDIANSIIVHDALEGMTPAIAMDERVWVRLTHIECLEYSRSRWIEGEEGEKLEKAITKHMFASGRDRIRDDNAISRLWWNMQIAKMIEPEDPIGTLEMMLLTSDYRMAFVERPLTSARIPLAKAIVRSLRNGSWLTDKKDNFLEFMKVLNRDAGGVLFEALPSTEADNMINSCILKAQAHLQAKGN